MTNSPMETKPTATFSKAIQDDPLTGVQNSDLEPVITDANSFKIALYSQGTQLGWLGEDGDEWAILVTDPQKALTLELYPYNGVNYYRIKGSSRYMSVSNGAYVGFYHWLGATGFSQDGTHLVSDYNHQLLSLYSQDNGYIYAWNDYSVLDVQLETIPKKLIDNQPLPPQIEHVVVVMLENRSFDNMLGGLYPEKTQQGLYRGLNGHETNPLDPSDPSKGSVEVFPGPADDSTWIMPYPDPGELFDDMNEQIFGTKNPGPDATPNMQGFAWNYSQQPGAPLTKDGSKKNPIAGNIMQYYTSDTAPMTAFLATQYAVCDYWFASGPVQTLSNRVFAHCGTPGRVPGTNNARINNPDFIKGWSLDPPFDPPVKEKTVFEQLDDSYPGEINWKVYYHDAPLSALCSYVYEHWKWFSWDGGNVFRFKEHFNNETNFEYDIINHRLPKYSFIEPRYTDFFKDGAVNSSHPGGAGIDFTDPNGSSLPPPISVTDGETLLKEIYEILSKYPDTFNKTLLVVTYDEHGGLYDHIGPPSAESPFTNAVDNFSYNRYGVRVPAILINPYIQPNKIYPARDKIMEHPFDHTSLISTICAQFGLINNLSPRTESAPMLSDLFPQNLQPYSRPAPPVIPTAATTSMEAPASVPPLDVAATKAIIDSQEKPHSLASVLTHLLSFAQKSRMVNIKGL